MEMSGQFYPEWKVADKCFESVDRGSGYNSENSGVQNFPNPLPGIEPNAFSHFVKL